MELKHFTSVTNMSVGGNFSSCSNLVAADFTNIKVLGGGSTQDAKPFYHVPIELVYLPSITTINSSYSFQSAAVSNTVAKMQSLPPRVFVLGANLVSITGGPYTFAYPRDKKIVILATTPPSCNSTFNRTGCLASAVIYVPDESIDAYKETAAFANWKSYILPLSEYTGERPWE